MDNSYMINDYEGGVSIRVSTQGKCFAVREETVQKLVHASDLLDLHRARS